MAGVRGVEFEGLVVDSGRGRGDFRRSVGPSGRTVAEVRQAVRDALGFDPRVKTNDVTVLVRDGIATLTGVVDNLAAKRAAEQDARNTAGVWGVRNFLKVRPESGRPDADVLRDVRAALARDPLVDRYRIGVSAYNGRVYLSGMVDTFAERARAESIASRVKGVVEVRNSLAVDFDRPSMTAYPSNASRDLEIREDIEDEMWWSPFVDAGQVTVSVTAGVATLTGTVDTWSESQAAVENAYEGGASRVVNDLSVRRGPDHSRPK